MLMNRYNPWYNADVVLYRSLFFISMGYYYPLLASKVQSTVASPRLSVHLSVRSGGYETPVMTPFKFLQSRQNRRHPCFIDAKQLVIPTQLWQVLCLLLPASRRVWERRTFKLLVLHGKGRIDSARLPRLLS